MQNVQQAYLGYYTIFLTWEHGVGESMSDYTLSFATSLTMLHFSSVAIAARVERTYLYARKLCHKPVCDMFIPANSFQSTLVRICNTHEAKTSILLLISVQSHSLKQNQPQPTALLRNTRHQTIRNETTARKALPVGFKRPCALPCAPCPRYAKLTWIYNYIQPMRKQMVKNLFDSAKLLSILPIEQYITTIQGKPLCDVPHHQCR